jgi:hypothetical protein
MQLAHTIDITPVLLDPACFRMIAQSGDGPEVTPDFTFTSQSGARNPPILRSNSKTYE